VTFGDLAGPYWGVIVLPTFENVQFKMVVPNLPSARQ
jgi:hypothetical protein